MHLRIKSSLKSFNEKSKHGNSFHPNSFFGVWAPRMESLTAGGMPGAPTVKKGVPFCLLDSWSVGWQLCDLPLCSVEAWSWQLEEAVVG